MLFSSSKIANLSPETGSKLLNNGTVQMLVMLRSSHLLYQPVNRNRKEMVKEYMKQANLKKNISKVLKEIIKCQNELKPEMNMKWDYDKWKLQSYSFFNHLSIFNVLEKIRDRIDRQYRQFGRSLDQKVKPYKSFTNICYRYLRTIEGFHYPPYRRIFEQLGGSYVLLDLLKILYILNDDDHDSGILLSLTVELLHEFHSFFFGTPEPICKLLGSPFYITLFFNLLWEQRKNESFVRHIISFLNTLLISRFSTPDYDTLQNCRAIPRLVGIMMKENDYREPENIHGWIHLTLPRIIARSGRARAEFSRIDGVMEFVVTEFVNDYSGLSDLPVGDPKAISAFFNKRTICVLLQSIVIHMFTPEVQNLFWDADVSTVLVGLIKLVQHPDNYAKSASLNDPWNVITTRINDTFETLYHIIEASQRERVKVRGLIDVEFLVEIMAMPSIGERTLQNILPVLNLLRNE